MKSREEFYQWFKKQNRVDPFEIYDHLCGECICGEINARHCPVHNELSPVSDEEIIEEGFKHAKRHATTGFKGLDDFLSDIRQWSFQDGYRAAMQRNARAEIEKLWPSEEDQRNAALRNARDAYDFASTYDAFISGVSFLRERLTGEK